MNIEVPPGWRKGQTLFNFLWWLNHKKDFHRELGFAEEGDLKEVDGRMADPFNIPDAKLEALFREFLLDNGYELPPIEA